VEISSTLLAKKHESGISEWLKNYGLTITETMVLDPQNAALPVPVRRQLGPIAVNEIKMMPYPHFPDLRGAGLNGTSPMTASLGQLTLNWASPIVIDQDKNNERTLVELLHSSENSWTSDALHVLPDYRQFPKTGFKEQGERSSRLLAVAVKGEFDSYFKGKKSPLLEEEQPSEDTAPDNTDMKEEETKDTVISGVIEHSSDSARILLISSNTFATDSVIRLASQGQGTQYTRPLDFIQNSIDWALDDEGLTAIRSRARFARMLAPMQQNTRLFWEYLNYGMALLGLGLIWVWRLVLRKRKLAHYERVLAEV
jgi:ABC-2 type transport system permease protein